MDCTVHGVAKSPMQLSDFHFTSLHFSKEDDCVNLWSEVRPHSSQKLEATRVCEQMGR